MCSFVLFATRKTENFVSLPQNSLNEEFSGDISALAGSCFAGGISLWSVIGRRFLPRIYCGGICRGGDIWSLSDAWLQSAGEDWCLFAWCGKSGYYVYDLDILFGGHICIISQGDGCSRCHSGADAQDCAE